MKPTTGARPPLVRTLRALVLCALVPLVAACGGGGGGSTTPSATPNPSPSPSPLPSPPPPAVGLGGTPLRWGDFQVTVPATLTATDYGNLLALDKPGCRITLWPTVVSQPDLDGLALAFLQSAFTDPARWGGVVGQVDASPLTEYLHHTGLDAGGRRFTDLRGELLNAAGRRSGEKVRIQMVDLGGRAAAMVGYETGGSCIDDQVDPYEFVLLAYSMDFPAFAGDPQALGRTLVGGWFGQEAGSGGVNIAWSDVFAANGQHSDAYVAQTFHDLSPTEYLDVLSGWFGNGRWATRGNLLTVVPNGGSASTAYFRIYRETGGFTYLRRLGSCGGSYCERWSTP